MNIQEAISCLRKVSDVPESDVKHLVAYVLDKPVSGLLWRDVVLTTLQQQRLEACIARRVQGEPVAYIIGSWDFMGLELALNSATLIPRPETEELVDCVLNWQSLTPTRSLKVLDMGTGSGAIAIALAKQRPHWQLLAMDKVLDAITLAKCNAHRHSVAGNIRFTCADWHRWQPDTYVDVVVANPPYIAIRDQAVAPDVAQYEPPQALYAAQDGLADCYAILQRVRDYLSPGGLVFMEHGWQQATSLRDYAVQCGYQDVASRYDLAGKERFLVARYGG